MGYIHDTRYVTLIRIKGNIETGIIYQRHQFSDIIIQENVIFNMKNMI